MSSLPDRPFRAAHVASVELDGEVVCLVDDVLHLLAPFVSAAVTPLGSSATKRNSPYQRIGTLPPSQRSSIDDHRCGLADKDDWSRNTRTARRFHHGLANRCKTACSRGASRPSAACEYDRKAS